MEKKLSINEKLNFTDIDMTPPEKVIEEILSNLPEETHSLIYGCIESYGGNVRSYIKKGFSAISQVIGSSDTEVDIQEDLGKRGSESHKFECYLHTPNYSNYKFRLFFIEYGIANYPVDVILERGLAKSAFSDVSYIVKCKTKDELEDLVYKVLNSKRSIEVMQDLIRINQSKRISDSYEETSNAENS